MLIKCGLKYACRNLCRWGQKTLRPPLHFCKGSRILTRATRANNKMLYYSLVGECLRESNQIFETAKHLRRKLRRINIVYDMSVSVVHKSLSRRYSGAQRGQALLCPYARCFSSSAAPVSISAACAKIERSFFCFIRYLVLLLYS